jgi:hypothetical protein
MRLSKVRPRIKYLCNKKQTQVSHERSKFHSLSQLRNNIVLDDIFIRVALSYGFQ